MVVFVKYPVVENSGLCLLSMFDSCSQAAQGNLVGSSVNSVERFLVVACDVRCFTCEDASLCFSLVSRFDLIGGKFEDVLVTGMK